MRMQETCNHHVTWERTLLIKPCVHMPEETAWLYRNPQTCDTVNPPSLHICPQQATLLPRLHTHSFILVFLPFSSPRCSSGHIPNLVSHTSPSPLPDWFSHSPGAPPCYHGDAAVTCQFRGGDALRPVVAQNRIVGEFLTGSGRAQHHVSDRMDSWL